MQTNRKYRHLNLLCCIGSSILNYSGNIPVTICIFIQVSYCKLSSVHMDPWKGIEFLIATAVSNNIWSWIWLWGGGGGGGRGKTGAREWGGGRRGTKRCQKRGGMMGLRIKKLIIDFLSLYMVLLSVCGSRKKEKCFHCLYLVCLCPYICLNKSMPI